MTLTISGQLDIQRDKMRTRADRRLVTTHVLSFVIFRRCDPRRNDVSIGNCPLGREMMESENK